MLHASARNHCCLLAQTGSHSCFLVYRATTTRYRKSLLLANQNGHCFSLVQGNIAAHKPSKSVLPPNLMSHWCSLFQAVTAVPSARESIQFAIPECIAARYPGEQLIPASPGSYLFSLSQRVHAAHYPGEQLMSASPGRYLFSLAQRVHCCSLPWEAINAR